VSTCVSGSVDVVSCSDCHSFACMWQNVCLNITHLTRNSWFVHEPSQVSGVICTDPKVVSQNTLNFGP